MSSDEVTPAPPAQESAPPALLDLASSLKDMGPAGALLTPLASPLERLLGIRELNRLYPLALEQWEQEGSFFKASLRTLGVSYRLGEADMARFPKEGPLIIVSNHPFGMLDGLIVGAILEELRPDFRLLGNRILEQIHPLRPWLISVNPFDQARGNAENARGLRSAIHWVKEGGALAVWPAGEVASLHLRQRLIRDPEWNHHCASLAQKGDATVVPLHFRGRNSWLFQGLGLVHPLLRTVLLARETLNKEGTEIPVSIGSPIPPQDLARLPDHRRRTRYLRLRTDILANRPSTTEPENHFLIPARIRHQETIIPPIPAERLSEEVASFSAAQCLLSYKQFDTFLFRASQAPHCLQEIGRLREISFRQEGEGSGKPCDLDDFDHTYEHLILWDREKNAIAGSYRIARTDQIVSQYGRQGLYTYSLFQFTDEFIDALTPALELGRSFIAPDYQRHHQTLLLLWRGVCAIAAEEPKYRRFFGPVSISNTYTQASKALITEYLHHGRDEDLLQLAAQVRPRHPFRKRRILGVEGKQVSALFHGVEEVSSLISDIEADRKGLPVLLKHYLRLHTTILSFNVDRQFSNCLDGLIITDLGKTDLPFLRRLVPTERLASFLEACGRTEEEGSLNSASPSAEHPSS